MRIIKSFVMAAVSLLAFESLTSAEMTAMSLQERMRRSEVVALAKILKTQYTDVNEFGFGSWMAECLVERYFKPEKFINVNTVKDNKSALIYIAFSRVPVPSHRQPPVELSEGKEYLLFLKEDKTLAKGGEIVYKMIAPRGGAFEAGQDYFVHDEQNPEYPQAVQMSFDEIVRRVTQKNPASVDIREQPERELSEDELRMKERLIALSRGEGDVADLRVELNDGGMLRHRNDTIANGKIISQEWDLAVPPKSEERAVTDEEIRQLLQTLIEHKYWTFKGTKFIPDDPGFMFRFHYKDLPPIEYSCQAHEYKPSTQLSAIRFLWLSFVSGVPSQDQASCEAQGGHWGRFGLMEKDQCNRLTTDAGKECFDHSECESDCVTDDSIAAGTEATGKCFEWTVMLGRCLNGVKDGKAQGVICAD